MFTSFVFFALLAVVFSLLIMTLFWRLSLALHKASIVDPAWSGIIVFLGLLYATLADGYDLRRFLAALMAVLWGTRLTFFILFCRVLGKGEDPRYQQLMDRWGAERNRKLFQFFMLQGLVAALFSLPFLIVSLNPEPSVSAWEWLAFILWAAAFAGEATADAQLELFKSDPANKGKTCRLGLWNYSRHPNYFFEFMIWCSVFLFSLASPYGFLMIICPVFMFHFLFNVTGIPKAEEQALKSRGEDYRDYQRKTRMFVPWFHKK